MKCMCSLEICYIELRNLNVIFIFLFSMYREKLIQKIVHFQVCFFSGTAGDSLSYHRGSAFTTKDRDNDADSSNCALSYKGGWWYNNCYHANLNGLYLNGKTDTKGMVWYHWKNSHYSVKRSEMKIRSKDF